MIVFMGYGITSRGQELGTVFGTAVKVHCTIALVLYGCLLMCVIPLEVGYVH